jgi:hypothetical protein
MAVARINIHGADSPHDTVVVAGNKGGLIALRDMIQAVLSRRGPGKAQLAGGRLCCSDDEWVEVQVHYIKTPMEQEMPPYTGCFADYTDAVKDRFYDRVIKCSEAMLNEQDND